MKIFFSPEQLLHAPQQEFAAGAFRPAMEVPERAASVLAAIQAASLGPVVAPPDYGLEPIARVHDPKLLAFLSSAHAEWSQAFPHAEPYPELAIARRMRAIEPASLRGKLAYYCFDTATPVLAGSWSAALRSAHSALAGIEALATGASAVFSLCRPPGHHAGRDYYGGYCFLNSAAIAAQAWLDRTTTKCAILDVDYHHGNGTQDIFYERDDMFFASLHADPALAYPFFSGYAEESGSGRGLGANLNLPLPLGTRWETFSTALARALEAVRRFGPAALIVSLGVDTYKHDPISGFSLETADFVCMAEAICDAALPTLVLLEGGYNLDRIGENVLAFLQGLDPQDK
jgi:acetoin utilization deacetylase AcuC-like enzyme